MEKRTITHGDITIVVGEATARMGIRRQVAIAQAMDWFREQIKAGRGDEDGGVQRITDPLLIPEAVLRERVYPACIGALMAEESKGLPTPLTVDAFAELPDDLVARWRTAALELNPHWLGREEENEAEGEEEPPGSEDTGTG